MNLDEYKENINSELSSAIDEAEEAKKGKQDPEDGVGMEIAEDLAERCEKLLNIPGMAEKIRELDEEYDREELVFKIAESFAEGEIGEDLAREEIVDKTIRASVAILTEGIVAAPIDGIGEIKIESGPNGEFIRVPYFGPIRSAGGTGQALSVLIADYIRQLLDIDRFNPTEDEVERYVEELNLYDKDTSLQYLPPDEDIRHIIRNCPVMIDGEQTEELEVGGYRNLDRIKGNRVRGGMCLVVGEGIGLKAPKMKRYTDELEIGGWGWIEELIETSSDEKDEEEPSGEKQIQRNKTPSEDWDKKIKPSKKFLKDALGGRPIFAGASKDGAFRLRYGRARNTGLAACGYHPATMVIVDKFIANGTQLKTERPGKAAGVAAVDYIEGPTVRLKNGEVRKIQTEKEAEKILNAVDKIIDLGEVLVPYGEFLENNHPIAPSPYVHEWWVQEYEKATGGRIPKEKIKYSVSKEIAQSHNIPIHPKFTYLWHDITKEEYKQLAEQVEQDKTSANIAPILEKLIVPHKKENNQIKIEEPHHQILKDTCSTKATGNTPIEMASNTSNYEIRHRSPVKIGARLGRPEKSSRREMTPPVRGLFPISDKGGSTRDIAKAATNEEGKEMDLTGKGGNIEKGKATVEVANMKCTNCGKETWKPTCPDCGKRTNQYWRCPKCKKEGHKGERCRKCDKDLRKKDYKEINIGEELERATNTLGTRINTIDTIKGVKGLTSSEKIPEPIEKAVLRTKHDIDTFRDGTSRYDITDLPLTSFKPKEIGLTPQQTKQLGYEKDINGNPITSDDQLIEIMPQDIIVSHECGEYLKRVADYTDELLQKYYEKEPYYEAENKEDLRGELLIGLAPHTSAGVLGRLIGFTKDKAKYTSPFYHAAKRRNCFHPETSINTQQNNQWQNTTIKQFVEKHLEENPQKDDFGTVYTNIENKNIKTESYNPEQKTPTIKQITHVNKHPSPNHLIKITTQTGKTLKITPDHPVLTYNQEQNKHKEKLASEVKEGDKLITEKHKHHIEKPQEIDILKHLLNNRNIENHNIMLKNIQNLKQLFKDKLNTENYLRELEKRTGTSKKTYDNYFDRNSIPADVLQKIYPAQKELLQKLPKDIKIGRRSQREEINRIIKLDHNVATLLGYYTAEGWYREQDLEDGTNKGVNQVTIAATEQESRNFLLRTFKQMGMKPYEEDEKKITVSGYNTKELFKTIFDTGYGAENKFIPEIIKNNNNKKVKAAYLSGYFSGDGHATTKNRVGCTIVSTELKNDIINILEKEFSIKTKVYMDSGRKLKESFPDFYDEDCERESRGIYRINVKDVKNFKENISFFLSRKSRTISQNLPQESDEEIHLESVDNIEIISYEKDSVYSIKIKHTNIFNPNMIQNLNCDGDEDSVMMLMDGLLNFSEMYLPDLRGKRTMDAPLVMTSMLDPSEVDDEAYNVDIEEEYPLEFYERSMGVVDDPGDVDISIAEETIDDGAVGLRHSIPTSDISAGPEESAYKHMGGMDDAIEKQLALAERTKGVDASLVGVKVIEKHLIPDIIGNLRAFSSQKVRCAACNTQYRRVPLSGECENCENDLIFTVHEQSVKKYLDIANYVINNFDVPEYTRERVILLENRIEQLFHDDSVNQAEINDFF